MTSTQTPSRTIAVLPGDGIGPEVTREAVRLLKFLSDARSLGLTFREGLLGGCAIDATGTPLPPESLDLCGGSDAVLVGAVGGPEWDHLPADRNPGLGGLLRLRREFDLYANLRPGVSYLKDQMPVNAGPVDILLVREAVGGAYFCPRRGRQTDDRGEFAFDTMEYTAAQVARVADLACRLARSRSGRLASVDKANVLESSKLWREVVQQTVQRYPDVEVEHLYVDNCAMQLVLRPDTFDVVVTENLFGDILSDEVAGIVGSLGLLPSGSLRDDDWGLYEPVHGAAPDIAGQDRANPTAAMLSAAMMLRHSFGLGAEARLVEAAVVDTLQAGVRTADIALEGVRRVGTREFGEQVVARLHGLLADDQATAEGASMVPSGRR
jgi:3-isopropylmalate dehydrogenase